MHLRRLAFDNLDYISDLNHNIMNNFLMSYNYLKNAFILENVQFPAELAAILESASTITTTQSSTNSNSTVSRSNINTVVLCYFADSVVILFSMKKLSDSAIYFVLEYRR